ncbi:hypothetical protein [Acinetobacter stercoris]|uniref:Uncharacterized protein n=1 Tax=Acinetobacter stercoris TaxID=2126983 RepID=A0A2U3MXZ7_9GAMM|nr:hypothetical protein [Acinetobacter stercoris]SPL70312.1 hypothetical protein KPC_1490 [Acinetobacter stercoris]
MPKYIAKHSIGLFMPGDEIKGLDAKRIQALLASKAIEEYVEPVDEQQEDDHSVQLAELTAKNAELNAMLLQLTTERDALRVENAELKIKVESFVIPVPDALNETPFEPLPLAENQQGTVQESVPKEVQPEVAVSKPKGRPPKAQTETVTKIE